MQMREPFIYLNQPASFQIGNTDNRSLDWLNNQLHIFGQLVLLLLIPPGSPVMGE